MTLRHHMLALVLLTTSLCGQAQESLQVRIGVEGAYPPFSQVAPDGSLRGFDIDIARALCEEMKARCTLVQQSFDGMIPSLQSRKLDAVIASMSITEERRRVVDFTHKYYHTPARLIARRSAALEATPAGLSGKRIAVQRATTHDRYATDKFTTARIVRYAKQDEVYLDLVAGRLDGALLDAVAANESFLRKPAGKDFAFVGPPFADAAYFGAGAGITVRKGDVKLRDAFNAALAAIRANGTYARLQARYFDFDVYGG